MYLFYFFVENLGLHCGVGVSGDAIGGGECKVIKRRGIVSQYAS